MKVTVRTRHGSKSLDNLWKATQHDKGFIRSQLQRCRLPRSVLLSIFALGGCGEGQGTSPYSRRHLRIATLLLPGMIGSTLPMNRLLRRRGAMTTACFVVSGGKPGRICDLARYQYRCPSHSVVYNTSAKCTGEHRDWRHWCTLLHVHVFFGFVDRRSGRRPAEVRNEDANTDG